MATTSTASSVPGSVYKHCTKIFELLETVLVDSDDDLELDLRSGDGLIIATLKLPYI